MYESGAGQRIIVATVLSSIALCVAVSCSSDPSKKVIQMPGGAGAADGGAAGAATSAGEAGAAGNTSVPAGGSAGEGGTAGEPGAAGQAPSAGTSGGGASGGGGAGGGGAGGGGAAGGSPGFTSIGEADFEATFAKIFCDSVAHCCSAGVATCLDTEAKDFASMHSSAKAANNVYDPVRAAQCANAIVALGDHATCSLSFMSREQSLLPCRGIFDGTAAPGDQCISVESCRQGIADQPAIEGYAGCLPFNGTSTTRCRQFVITTTPGATCLQGNPTAGPDSVVHICSQDMTCESAQCVPLPKLGDACPDGACFNAMCSAAKCVAYTQAGQTCTNTTCEAGYECVADKCTKIADGTWILDAGFFATTYMCPS